jgi:membrane associated rhomboid family serine protease
VPDALASIRRFPVSVALTALVVLVFAGQVYLGLQPDVMLRLGALRGDRVLEHHEIWRMWTVAFLHGGWLHIALNLVALVQLAALVELVHGGRRLVLSWFVCSVTASVASIAGSDGYLPAVGASGPLFGLIGVLLGAGWWGFEPWRSRIRELISGRLLFAAALTLAIGVALSLVAPMVDNAGHVGGLVGGLALSAAWRRPPGRAVAASVAAALSVVVVAGSFGLAARFGPDSARTYHIDTARKVHEVAARTSNVVTAAGLTALMAERYDDAGPAYAAEGLAAAEDLARARVSVLAVQYAHAFLAEERPAYARVFAERWLVIAPNDPMAMNVVAWALVTVEPYDPARAEVLARRAIAVGGVDRFGAAAVADTLALALWMQGRTTEALWWQRDAVARSEGLDDKTAGAVRQRLAQWEAYLSGQGSN